MDLVTKTQKEYSLIDSGDGEKLEKFGDVFVLRPESQALWPKSNLDLWQKATAIYTKEGWKLSKNVSEEFEFEINGIKAQIHFGKGRNVGVFPEYTGEWQVLEKLLKTKENPSVLNLFAYTGLSSIASAKAGAQVVHVDASKISNETAKTQADKNNVGDKIRFITEDCLAFMKREIRRGNKYDLIVLDPPVFGRGAKGQVFKIEDEIGELVATAKELLAENGMGIFLNGYASEYSVESYKNILKAVTGMETIGGNLSIEEDGGRLNLPIAKWAFAYRDEELKNLISAE